MKVAGFTAAAGPWTGISYDDRRRALVELGEKSEIAFGKILAEVQQLVRRSRPVLSLSLVALYGLFSGLSEEGKVRESYLGEKFSQSHVELLQALLLQIAESEVSQRAITPEEIQRLFEVVPTLSLAYQHRRLKTAFDEVRSERMHLRPLQEWVRMHTQGVRHWTFFDHATRLLIGLCSPEDKLFTEIAGIRFSSCVTVFAYLVRNNDARASDHWQRLRFAAKERTVEGMIRAFHTEFPEAMGSIEETLRTAKQMRLTLEQTTAMILEKWDLLQPAVFTSTPLQIASATELPLDEVTAVLQRFSLRQGDLKGLDAESFFLANPIWLKPMIAMSEETYFCPLPQVFFSHSFAILQDMTAASDAARARFSKRRSEFLEDSVEKLFTEHFPGAQVARGYSWRDGDTTFENDLIVRIDTHLLLVEAKSGSISPSALRGAPDRMRRHLDEVLVAPSIQSARLADRVKEVLATPADAATLLPRFPIELDGVGHVLRLSVTLEDFATIQSRMHSLRATGIAPIEHAFAPCILLTDLELVFDVLDSPGHKLHYLHRRSELESHFDYAGDELDLLGFYLETAFAIGTAEFSKDKFTLLGFSKEIDLYYMVKQEGIVTAKPEPRMTLWWKRICAAIESRRSTGWSTLVTTLLGASLHQQNELEAKFSRVKKNVRRNFRNPNHQCSVVLIQPSPKTDAIALFAYVDADHDRRKERVAAIASKAFESQNVERCVVVGINIDFPEPPYSFVYLLLRSM